jgi:hypothetical protein
VTTPRSAAGEGASPDVLTIQIQGGEGEPERVLLVDRPVGERVRVREWSSDASADTTEPRDWHVEDVLALVTRAQRSRRWVSEDAPTVRRWLGVPGD